VATLAELGLGERMLAAPFSADDFPSVEDVRALAAIFQYLHSIDLVKPSSDGSYELTTEGQTVFKRSGGFLLLHSYREYFNNLGELLKGEVTGITVDRRHNVLGSGSLHSKKFFPAVWEVFRKERPEALIDIGCGDGHFLEHACAEVPTLQIAAVDLSPIAIETTLTRLETIDRFGTCGIVASGEDVDQWISNLPESIRYSPRLTISMWFVAHEFSGGDQQRVVRFFRKVRSSLPPAEVLLGEITALPPDLLADNRDISIMPEFLLFHALSNQGVLAWESWRSILKEIPYALIREDLFDIIGNDAGLSVPSSFVWYLRPI
jgi:SAM-dependent methyltransferase